MWKCNKVAVWVPYSWETFKYGITYTFIHSHIFPSHTGLLWYTFTLLLHVTSFTYLTHFLMYSSVYSWWRPLMSKHALPTLSSLWCCPSLQASACAPPFDIQYHHSCLQHLSRLSSDTLNSYPQTSTIAVVPIYKWSHTIPWTPFHDSADTLSRFHRHPFTIRRTPLHDSADTLARFRGHPCMIPRIPSAMPRKNCGFPTRTICGFRKVSCDKYHMSIVWYRPSVGSDRENNW